MILSALRAALRRRRAQRSVGLETLRAVGFVAIDLETTGLDPRRDAVVALAAIPFVDGEPRDGYVTLVNPRRPIPPASTQIHGITDDDVRDAPPIDAVLPVLEAVLGGQLLVGHAVEFDLAILARDARESGRGASRPLSRPAFLDTQALAASLLPRGADVGLDAVAAHVGVVVHGRHTAQGDAIAAGRVLLALLPRLATRGAHTLRDAQWIQSHAPVPGRRV
jgi:DNA polymerase III epsilon subunit-like protein